MGGTDRVHTRGEVEDACAAIKRVDGVESTWMKIIPFRAYIFTPAVS